MLIKQEEEEDSDEEDDSDNSGEEQDVVPKENNDDSEDEIIIIDDGGIQTPHHWKEEPRLRLKESTKRARSSGHKSTPSPARKRQRVLPAQWDRNKGKQRAVEDDDSDDSLFGYVIPRKLA